MRYRPDLDEDFPYAVLHRIVWPRGSSLQISSIISNLTTWLNENINTESDVNYKLADRPAKDKIVFNDGEIMVPFYIYFRHGIDALRFELTYN